MCSFILAAQQAFLCKIKSLVISMLKILKALFFDNNRKPTKPYYGAREEIRATQRLARTSGTTRSGAPANAGGRRTDRPDIGSRENANNDTINKSQSGHPSWWDTSNQFSNNACESESHGTGDSSCDSE